MKYWDPEYVETRDIYEGEFRSPITTTALRGNIMENKTNTIVATYEFEILKDVCDLKTRMDPTTYENITDMCVTAEYRTKSVACDTEQINIFPLPLSEMTEELTQILIDNKIIK